MISANKNFGIDFCIVYTSGNLPTILVCVAEFQILYSVIVIAFQFLPTHICFMHLLVKLNTKKKKYQETLVNIRVLTTGGHKGSKLRTPKKRRGHKDILQPL